MKHSISSSQKGKAETKPSDSSVESIQSPQKHLLAKDVFAQYLLLDEEEKVFVVLGL